MVRTVQLPATYLQTFRVANARRPSTRLSAMVRMLCRATKDLVAQRTTVDNAILVRSFSGCCVDS